MPSYWERKLLEEKKAPQKKKWGTPPTPKVVSQPPTPTVTGETRAERERRLRRTQRQAYSASSAMAGFGSYSSAMAGMGGTSEEFAIAGTDPLSSQRLLALLGRAGRGFLGATGLQEPLSRLHVPMVGRGGIPYRAQPAQVPKTAAELAAIYSTAARGEPTHPWYMQDPTRGGTAGRTREIATAWAGGSLPVYVPKSVLGLMGDRISEDDMKDAGYRRTLGGGWKLEDTRPPLDVDGGDGYGYGPYSYGAGRYSRPVAGAQSYGLVNWRIGL